ncbi:unnamed protein product [Rotaria sp. Silwood2]|nr:unnamed protein product [Rotaria sp. Silwood2]
MLTEKKTFFSSLSGYYALAELHTFYTCSQADLNSVLTIFTAYRAGLTKHSLPIDNSGVAASFSYSEKGSRNPEKPSIVFVHGLSSNKETWIPIIKNISGDYHCITVDLPGHGETIGFQEDMYTIDKFVEKLKLFFDAMDLTEPMCIIGASMGGAVVCMFAIKYPEYVSMICLLAPIDKYNDVEPISTDLSSEQVLNPFQCSYRCRVLYHYPPEVPNNTFDEDTISRLSMPDGVSIRQNSSDPSTTHPFLIARFDGTRYYAVALTFSEQINNDDESLTESLSTSSSSSSTTIN